MVSMENYGPHLNNNSEQVFDFMGESMENDVRQLINNNNDQVLDFMGGIMQNAGHQLMNSNEQVLGFMGGTMQNDARQLMNSNNVQVPDYMGDDTSLNYSVEYDVPALLGTEDHHDVGSNQRACTHPGPEARKELGERIGLDERQVKFWFQNRRCIVKLKACGEENKDMLEENTKLRAENSELKQQLLMDPTCLACRNPTGAIPTTSDKWLLLSENARLKDELLRAKAYLNMIRGSQQHTSMSASASNDLVPPTNNQQVTFFSHADRALNEFIMLATKGQPMWLPTIDGEVLRDQEYDLHTFPGILGVCPRGYIVEATRDTDMIKATAIDIVNVLTNVAQWSGMFSNIVAYIDAEFWVQSPRLPTRSVKFLRFSKMMKNRTWAVVDVSINGNHGVEQESSGTSYMGYRLLPSGCLLEDMSGGFCKVTWVVHSEYQEATLPPYFRQFFHSGKAFGARRWLKSLQRQCDYMGVLLHSSINVPTSGGSSSSAGTTMSALGKRGVLELAQRMTASFYSAVSGPIAVPATNIVDQLCVSSGTGAKRLEAGVRMVTWNCAEVMPGEPVIMALSATATVWLPGTPPQRVFEYLCNLQRRGEWDNFLNGRAVQQLEYQAVPDGSNGTNNMVILQQTSSDMSGSLVVYSLIEENMMRHVMGGADNAIFLLPSGFAILPDGHDKAHYTSASSSSSAPIGHNNGAGAILTVAFQEMLSRGNLDTETFDSARQKLCHAIKKIRNAVGANNVIPA
ncbi:hypothetical protein HU200_007972 [Digitaria exilis]|uniref:Uncharacterized protein n=1 Tax=Digitaria exilis TaxID=1010633 RepID=A0A835FNA5_9POAL|nr:hypothetical protein HU200_007972 [Digitaria exilis]